MGATPGPGAPPRLSIAIAPHLRRAMLAHARRARPNECCGLLVGRARQVLHVVPLRNVDESPTSYRIDDRDHLELRRLLRQFVPALAIIGTYHSHPRGPAVPSPRDLAEAYYPDWAYLVIGLASGRAQLRAYRLRGSAMTPIAIRGTSARGANRR